MLRIRWIAPMALLFAAPVATARAQLLHRATDPVATPASSIVLQDDALAMDHNPAALGFLEGPSLSFLHAEVDQRDSWLARGDAFYLATPVLGLFTLGATLQSIRPDEDAARPPGLDDADRAMGALSIAFAPSPALAMGLTTRGFSSGNGRFDGLAAIDAGITLRPSPWLGLYAVGRDLFVSREGFGTAGLDLGSSAMLGVSLRPFAREELSLDAALVIDTGDSDRMAGRGGVTVQVPYLGSASGLVEVEDLGDADAAVRVVAELAVQFAGVTAAVGGTDGDGFADIGGYGMLRLDGQPRRGIPSPVRVLDLELSGVGARGMIGLAILLDRARLDPRIGGVLLRMRGAGLGLAYAQELRLMIETLRASGKPVVCHLDSADGSSYYACAGANDILLDPAGDVRLMGLSSEVMLYGGTLRKIGVRADFVRIGDYKSAPEQYTQDEMSEASREQVLALLDSAHQRMLVDLAKDLKVSQARVADLMDEGPYLARRAVQVGLVSHVADEFELGNNGELTAFGGRRLEQSMPRDPARPWGVRPSVGVILIDDSIVDGDSVDIPLIDIHMTGGRTIVREIDAMARDPNIRAIVLRVDSPGGAVVASDQIWRAVRRAREHKPVIASMGAVAASGGYYVACGADEIWADPSTLTGSIGIFYGKVDLSELAATLGVTVEQFSRGKRAGGQSMFRPFTGDERAALADSLREYYQQFLERVAEGRGMKVSEVDALARGRVYSGDAALNLGLVDRLGGMSSALVRARNLAGLSSDAGVVVRPERGGGIVSFLLGGGVALGGSEPETAEVASDRAKLTREVQPLLRALVGIAQMRDGEALALLPFALEL